MHRNHTTDRAGTHYHADPGMNDEEEKNADMSDHPLGRYAHSTSFISARSGSE